MKSVVIVGGVLLAIVGTVAVGARSEPNQLRIVSDPFGIRRAEEQAAELRVVAERTRTKRDVAASLIRGERTVEEAAAVFRKLLASDPVGWELLRLQRPGATDEEIVYHNLAAFVELQRRTDPERVAAVQVQLTQAIARNRSGSAAGRITVR